MTGYGGIDAREKHRDEIIVWFIDVRYIGIDVIESRTKHTVSL